MSSRRKWRDRGLGVAVFLLTLVGLECGLRLFAPESLLRPQTPLQLEFLQWNPFRGSYLAAGFERPGVPINADGRRGAPLDPTRPRKIVCLGDSSTFGVWKAGGEGGETRFDNYPEILQASLDARGYSDWEVVNAGVPGSHAGHSLRILRRDILKLDPEIVTLRIGANDHARELLPWVDDPANPLVRKIFYALGRLRLFMLAIEVEHRLTVNPETADRVMPPAALRRALDAFIEESRRYGFHLLLIDYPLRMADASDKTARQTAWFYGERSVPAFAAVHESYQEIVEDVARSADVPLLVTAPTLHDPDAPGFRGDLIHPNATGMKQTAGLLFEALQSRGWLD